MIKNKECQILQYGIRVVTWNSMHGKDLHRLWNILQFRYFQGYAIWLLLKEMWDNRHSLTNELLCKICGRYLSIGCQCDSLKKQPCALCDQEYADALQKHMLRYH